MAVFNYFMFMVIIGATYIDIWESEAASLREENPSITSDVKFGRLMAMEKDSGTLHSLHRRDLASFAASENHNLQLQMDDRSDPLEIDLVQGSVWGPSSVLGVRVGAFTENLENVTRSKIYENDLERGCYIYGRVTSRDGALSINMCGILTGILHTQGQHYNLEEVPPLLGEESHTRIQITKTASSPDDSLDIFREADEVLARLEISVDNEHKTTRQRREVQEATIELALFADATYMQHLSDLGYNTTEQAKEWFIHRWNTIQGVYTDVERVGFKLSIRLKQIELWLEDPPNYIPKGTTDGELLRWFCRNTPQADGADQKVLYTRGRGGQVTGLAYLGMTCRRNLNCFFIKWIKHNVFVDIHEMGHSLGLPHEPQIKGCQKPYGFMGWGNADVYTYKNCYRESLTNKIRTLDCLFREDFFPEPSSQPSPVE